MPRKAGVRIRRRQHVENVRTRSAAPAQASASAEANATTRRDAESAASSGTTTSQIAAKDSMPPVVIATVMTKTRQRQRRQHMRALVAAGTRQKPRQQNGRDQPGEGRDLKGGGRAAHRKIDRECRERRQASEQPRRDEGAMARARQRVISRRRMQQRIETIADDIQNCHGFRASACSSNQTRRNAPFIVAPPCQSEIKRTLRRGGARPKTARSRGFRAAARRSIRCRW